MKKILILILLLVINIEFSFGAVVYNQDNKISIDNILKIIEKFEKEAGSENGIILRRNMLQKINLYGINSSTNIDDAVIGFLFHMVKLQIGEEKFNEGLLKVKSLKDIPSLTYLQILRCFNPIDAESFYESYFNKNPLIHLNISDAEYITEKGQYYISFTILRTNGDKLINIPYMIEYSGKKEYGRLQSSINKEEVFKVPVTLGESTLYIDPNYHLLRKLGENEKSPVITDMLLQDDILLITNKEHTTLENYFKISEKLKDNGNITFSQIENRNIIIDGYNSSMAQFFTDKKTTANDTSDYYIFKNPQNKEKFILITNNASDDNLKLLEKYGMSEEVVFKGGTLIKEYSKQKDMGIKVLEHKANTFILSENTSSVDTILKKAITYNNIFIGEVHTEYSHHATQLAFIQQIYNRKKKIAIAMEMVQAEFQLAINDFVKGRISEKEMLEKIKYYDNWSYDYSLYAPIFQFARDNNIDIIPLNIPRSITSKVYNGSIDNLTLEEKKYLPTRMNVINQDYEQTLYEIFNIHSNNSKEFSNFYLSQNIWDEVMAKNMADYRLVNPNVTIIAICGNGHAGKNSGIPYRYKRLTGEDSFVIMQGENIDKAKADVFIYPEEITGKSTPKIGVILEEKNNSVKITSVAKKSPAEKAGLKTGDIFIKCGYNDINTIGHLKYALYDKGYNTVLECDILRGKNKITTKINILPYEEDNMDDMIKAHVEKMKNK